MKKNSMGIYIHIPFCVKKCNYCDFLSFPAKEELQDKYLNALIKEIENSKYQGNCVSTIFFGGGTPSLPDSKYLGRILSVIHRHFDVDSSAEITLECNPGTVSYEKFCDYKKMGINRLSIGLQSACNDELKALGRIHTFELFTDCYEKARKAGFNNINIDIMSALPGQTITSYASTLNKVLALNPEHISSYSLIIEEGTPFFQIYDDYQSGCNHPPLPDEDTEREMYYLTDTILREHGFERYEISNYSKKGFECRHNISYWTRRNYIGFGLGASSFANGMRFKNISDLNEYIEKIYANASVVSSNETEILSLNDSMSEFMFLGMRLMKGISKKDFLESFGKDIYDVYEETIKKFISEGLLTEHGDTIALTSKGIDVSNYVFAEFI